MHTIDVDMRPKSLHGYQEMFQSIYGEHNKRVFGDSPGIYGMQFLRGVGIISELLRKDRGHLVIEQKLPTMFGWLCGFWNAAGVDIEDATWHKFPGRCPYCRALQNCLCIAEEKVYTDDVSLNAYRRDHGGKPRTLKELQAMHKRIYGRVNDVKMRVQVWDHFVEELGEMGAEFLLNNRVALLNESADVMMWLLAFCNRLDADLDELTWRKYPAECNTCAKMHCECPPIVFETQQTQKSPACISRGVFN